MAKRAEDQTNLNENLGGGKIFSRKEQRGKRKRKLVNNGGARGTSGKMFGSYVE